MNAGTQILTPAQQVMLQVWNQHQYAEFVLTPVSQVVGHDRIVDESIFTFTHDREMAWMLPGVPATGRKVQISVVGVVQFRDGKVANEHLHYDHAGFLAQLGLIPDDPRLAIGGAAAARKLLG